MKFLPVLLILATLVEWSMAEEHFINVKHGESIAESSDDYAIPCSDFYQTVCGKWSEKHPDHENVYDMVNHEVNMELIKYMENTHMNGKPKFVKKAFEFYTSCADLEQFDGLHYMQWLEENENMTWALLSSFETEDEHTTATFDWVRTLGLMRRYGMNNVFIEESMMLKKSPPTEKIVRINKPTFSALNEEDMETLKDSIKLPEDAQTSFADLWCELNEFELLLEQLRDEKHEEEAEQVMSLSEIPNADVLNKYLESVFGEDALNGSMKVAIGNIEYIEGLQALLKQYNNTFICCYLEVRFLWHLLENSERSSPVKCMTSTRGFLPSAMDFIYTEQHPQLQQDMQSIYAMLTVFGSHMSMSMSFDTKGIIPKEFLEKLRTIVLKIGNIPLMDTIAILESHYGNLTLSSTDYYGNHLQLLRLYFNAQHLDWTFNGADYSKFFDKTQSYDLGSGIRPYYSSATNTLIVPPGLIRYPFYHWGYLDIFKFSSLGTTLAYSIYEELARLNGFSGNDIERIAVFGSMNSLYHAMLALYDMNKNDSLKRSTARQMFFFSAAYIYCQKDITDAKEHNNVNLVTLKMPEFTELFECKLAKFLDLLTHM